MICDFSYLVFGLDSQHLNCQYSGLALLFPPPAPLTLPDTNINTITKFINISNIVNISSYFHPPLARTTATSWPCVTWCWLTTWRTSRRQPTRWHTLLIGEVAQSRRRPLLGPSPGWKRLLALSHLRHYAKRALTPRSLNVKLGLQRNYHKGQAVWLA